MMKSTFEEKRGILKPCSAFGMHKRHKRSVPLTETCLTFYASLALFYLPSKHRVQGSSLTVLLVALLI
jgi:hypothetical protein